MGFRSQMDETPQQPESKLMHYPPTLDNACYVN